MEGIPMSMMLMVIVALVAIALGLLLMGHFGDIAKYWANETENEQSKVQHEIAGYNSHYCIKTIGDLCIGV